MPALELPKGKTLYDILLIQKETANESIIKKSYRTLALKYHPDKQSPSATPEEKEHKTYQFQLIGLAYSILSDKTKKSNYDRTGSLREETWLNEDKNWNDYFKQLWTGVVNEDTVAAHAKKYKDSKEETRDVLKYYKIVEGNMDQLLNFIMHSEPADVPRFIKIIQNAIKENKVEHYYQFDTTTTSSAQVRRVKKAEQERKKAEKEKKRLDAAAAATATTSANAANANNSDSSVISDNSDSSLQSIILQRQRQRWQSNYALLDGIIDRLAVKMDQKNATKNANKNDGANINNQAKNSTKKKPSKNNDDDDDVEGISKKNIAIPKRIGQNPLKKKVNKNKRKLEKSTEANEADSTPERPTKILKEH